MRERTDTRWSVQSPPKSEENNYILLDRLGEGGFGEVWLARDRKKNQKVALKFLRWEQASEQFVDFFKREFEILCELKHVHLARVFEFGYSSTRQQYFFSSEYCPGKNLLEAVKDKPISFFEETLVQILSALDCIHTQGIIHFDIKPENILVSEQDGHPHVKLVDFGLAARLKTLPEGRGGTLAFMAPEIPDPNASIDHRADLYALGMLSLLALTNRLPFTASDPAAIKNWHRQGTFSEKLWEGKDLPGYLREITEKLLAKSPSDRFSNARVVINFLNLATGGKYENEEKKLQAAIPSEGPLVEREGILKQLQKRLAHCHSSEKGESLAPVLFLRGEMGIGKSRILEEVRHFAQLKEIRCLFLRCDWEIPTWPRLAQSLKLPPIQDELSQEWQIRRKADALCEAARKTPLCLLLDDFQKAEGEMKQILKILSKSSLHEEGEKGAARLLVLAATDEKAGEGEIPLARLSLEGVSRYLRLVLGETERLETLTKILHQYSGGLPLLVVEGIKFLAPHFYRGESLENLLPPPVIRLLYQNRLSTLDPEEEEILSTAALLFRPASPSELQQISGKSSSALTRSIHLLLQSGLVKTGPSVFSTAQEDITYQVENQALALDLIQGLAAEKRKNLHLKIARGLERAHEKGEQTPVQEIAYHLAKAGQNEEAIAYYRKAERGFKKQSLISLASDCLNKALPLTEVGSTPWQELLEELAGLQILSGAYDAAEDSLKKLETSSFSRRDELKGWLAFKQRNFREAREYYQRTLKDSPEEDYVKKILIENVLANIDLHEGNLKEAATRFQKTLEWEQIHQDQKSPFPEGRPIFHNNNLGLALALLGEAEAALIFFQNRLRTLSPDHRNEEISLLNGIGFVYLHSSRYEEAISSLKKAMHLAEKTGALHTLFSIMGNLTTALLKEGRYAESLSILKKIAAYQERMGNRRDVAYNLIRRGSVYLNLGMKEAAFDCLLKGKNISEATGEENLKAWFLLMGGYWEKDFGLLEKAQTFFLQTEQAALKLQDPSLLNWSFYAQAELAYEQGDLPRCSLLVGRIQGNTQDEEFEARLRLLQTKIVATKEAPSLFSSLETHCLNHHLRELLWEIYHAWGRFEWTHGSPATARTLFENGVQVAESIAQALPEEYRDRYLHQKNRKKLYEDLEEVTHPVKRPFFQRLKNLFIPHGISP